MARNILHDSNIAFDGNFVGGDRLSYVWNGIYIRCVKNS